MKTYLKDILTLFSMLTLLATACNTLATENDDEEELEFDVARIFLELNNTDGDLGIHAEIDGEEWKHLSIEDPRERKMLNIRVLGRLRRQGLTEIFFESAEPNFDDLPPETFFRRFPEGEYEIEARTLDREEMEAEVELSHVIPGPPANILVNGIGAADDCDADERPLVSTPVVLSWDAVNASHPELGKPGNVEVEYYEVVVEIDDTPFKTASIVTPEVTEFAISDDFIELGDEFKFEILVRSTNGNKTATESCFDVE